MMTAVAPVACSEPAPAVAPTPATGVLTARRIAHLARCAGARFLPGTKQGVRDLAEREGWPSVLLRIQGGRAKRYVPGCCLTRLPPPSCAG
jgi:hypothetical protein